MSQPDTSRAAVLKVVDNISQRMEGPCCPGPAYHDEAAEMLRALLDERDELQKQVNALVSRIYNDAMFISQRRGVSDGEQIAREVCALCCTKPATVQLCRSCAQPVIDGLEEPSGPKDRHV